MAKQPDPVENLPAPPGGPAPAAKPSLLPVIIIVLAIPLITIGMWEFVMMPSIEKMVKEHGGAAAAEGAEEHAEEKKEGGHGEGERGESVLTYEVKDVVANLSGSLRSRYIKVSFTLESRQTNFSHLMEQNRAKVIDATLSVLSNLTLQDLEEPGIKNIVRNQLINQIGQALKSNAVEQLYFSEFVVQ